MEVTALCARLLINVLFLLCAPHQRVDSMFLRVDGNRLQFFEYEPLALHCEGLKEEELLCRGTKRLRPTGSSCIINNTFPEDSGEYWCENRGGKKSSSINISITAGSVILESPVLPVVEGDPVTLHCRNKSSSSSSHSVDFYKDGRIIRTISPGVMTIHSVSKSDEGLYSCRISGGGESPVSRLYVRETSPACYTSILWIIVTAFLMILLFAVGLLHVGKGCCRTASAEAGAAEVDNVMHAVERKKRKKKDEDESFNCVYYTLGPSEAQHLDPSAGTNPCLMENAIYSTVKVAE